MIVADTTLLIHIAVPSSKPADADAAEAVARRDAVWIVPPVWASEVRHVVAKYVRGAFMTSENALSVVRRIETLVVVTPVSHEEVLDAAFRFELSGYDAEVRRARRAPRRAARDVGQAGPAGSEPGRHARSVRGLSAPVKAPR